jgi:hypothetical protein
MTLTTHAVVGASMAVLVPQHPIIAFCAAFASHFLIDAIPHRDYSIASASINPKIGAPMKYDRAFFRDVFVIGGDALLGVALSLLFFATPQNFVLVFFCACAGILPDPLQFVYAHFRHEPLISLQRFHHWIHTRHHMRESLMLGVSSQLLFLAAVIVCVKVL